MTVTTRIAVKCIEGRLDSVEAENHKLRSDIGRLRWMVFKQISEVARIEVHLGLDKPRKRPPGSMVKELADTTGWSPSGLRKLAKRRAAAGDPIGQWHGGRLFLDPTKVPARR